MTLALLAAALAAVALAACGDSSSTETSAGTAGPQRVPEGERAQGEQVTEAFERALNG